MTQLVTLPIYVTAPSAPEVVAACRQIMDAEDDIEIDASQVRFVDPFGMAMLGATFHTIRSYGDAVRVSGLSPNIGSYLQRMDVFDGVELVGCALPEGRRLNRADALVELTLVDRHANAGDVAFQIAQALVGHTGLDPNERHDEMTGYNRFDKLVEPLHYALSELLENSLTHARRRGYDAANVWVASQYYETNGLVRLGVVDNGCGFLNSLIGHPELPKESSHLQAILTALRPRVSCNREVGIRGNSVNQGVGLTTTNRIAAHARGGLVIVSGDAVHDTRRRSFEIGDGSFWQGVAIAMVCQRDALREVRYRDLLPHLDDLPRPRLRFG